jgi:hypothetical protein
MAAAEFEMISFKADPDALQEIDVEHLKANNPDALVATGNLFFLLNRWRQMGAAISFSFEDLMMHSLAAGDAPQLMKGLLGEQWKLWFPPEVKKEAIIPRQAALVLLSTLERAKHQYEDAEAAKAKAQTDFEAISQRSGKRRKT